MTVFITLIIWYLVGYVISYIAGKTFITSGGLVWTQSDRRFILATSLFSWLTVMCLIFLALKAFKFKDSDKPAKW